MSRSAFNVDKAFRKPDLIGVMISGGLDSTTALYMALKQMEHESGAVVGISFTYGQRHCKEVDVAANICNYEGVQHTVIDISNLIPPTTLTMSDIQAPIPALPYEELKGVSPTYVPFRNGLMISVSTAHLIGELDARISDGTLDDDAVAHLYAGMHAGDAEGFAYPDCTPEFAGSMANGIWMGTYGRIRLVTPLILMSKAEVVIKGDELDAPLEKTWSCYMGGDRHCGECPTCRARKHAFACTHITDPTIYEVAPDDVIF